MYAKILLMTAVLLAGQVFAQTTPATTPTTKAKVKKKKKVAPATTGIVATPVTQTEEVKKEELKTKVPTTVVAPDASITNQVFTYMQTHFSASYHGEYYFVRRDITSDDKNLHDIQDLNYMHNPTVIYKPFTDWQVLASAEFKYTDFPGGGGVDGTYVNDYHRSLFTLTRKNLISEKESGIKLDAGIGRRDFNTRTTPSNYGNYRAFTTLTKTYGKNNGSLFVQYLHNDPKLSTAKTWKHGVEVIPTINIQLTESLSYLFNDDINFNLPKFKTTDHDYSITHEMNVAYLNYQLTDKINTYYQFKYLHSENFANGPKEDYFAHYVGVGYALSPKMSITGEVGSELFRSYDGKDFFTKAAQYPEFAIYLDASI